MTPTAALERLRGRLVVSCQAPPGDPLRDPEVIGRLAESVLAAGASGVRVDTPEHVRAVLDRIETTVVGLWKDGDTGVYITPTLEHALAVAEAGAQIVAVDGTERDRPDGRHLGEVITQLHDRLGVAVLADVATLPQGLRAAALGADAVASTLAGYVGPEPPRDGPDLDLVEGLAAKLDVPVVAEGRIRTPSQARQALQRGAFAVVVGTAITSPAWITRRFLEEVGQHPTG